MDKTAIILGVGPAEGLGANLSMHAARAGLHVFISGRTESAIEKIASQIINEGGKATAFCADATNSEEVSSLVDRTEQAGPIDLAVYNAGNAFPGDFITMSPHISKKHGKFARLEDFFSQNVIKKMLAESPERCFSRVQVPLLGVSQTSQLLLQLKRGLGHYHKV